MYHAPNHNMAKSRNSDRDDSRSDESNADSRDSSEATSDEPVNLSQLRNGVLHNPPQASERQDSDSTTEE